MKMAELRAALTDAGLVNVATLQVAGNVVFDEALSGVDDPAKLVRETVRRRFGHDLAVIVRSHDDLTDAMRRHPFLDDAAPSRVSITFLDEPPSPELAATVDHDRFEVERFAVSGAEIFLCHPDGQGTSKLTLAWLERRLSVVGTARNVNTINKLIEMTTPT